MFIEDGAFTAEKKTTVDLALKFIEGIDNMIYLCFSWTLLVFYRLMYCTSPNPSNADTFRATKTSRYILNQRHFLSFGYPTMMTFCAMVYKQESLNVT